MLSARNIAAIIVTCEFCVKDIALNASNTQSSIALQWVHWKFVITVFMQTLLCLPEPDEDSPSAVPFEDLVGMAEWYYLGPKHLFFC